MGGDEAGRGKGGLAKGREGVDPKAVEGTSHPFAPPEKVSRVALGNARRQENFPPVGLQGGRGGALGGVAEGLLVRNCGKQIHLNLTLRLNFW